MYSFKILLICGLALGIWESCGQKNVISKAPVTSNDTYFSIKGFILDQWSQFGGNSYGCSIKKVVNGKVDSTFKNTDSLDWAPIINVFGNTDIGDTSMIGKYEFVELSDSTTGNEILSYTAKYDSLPTRVLNIAFDSLSKLIKSIYIETQKDENGHKVSENLLYVPLKFIQIHTLISDGKEPYDSSVKIQFY